MSIIEVRRVSKEFPGVKALKDVIFSVERGEIHALCGENGAGKSTLMKILSGLHHSGTYTGEVHIAEKLVRFHGTRDSRDSGIAIVYQELSLIPDLTVAENVFLGKELSSFGVLRRSSTRSEAKKLLDSLGLNISVETPIHRLGVGEMQLIEIAKALVQKPKILILDEPTSALSHAEIQLLIRILKQQKQQGTSVILISHKLDEVFAVADRITVLRDGATIKTLDAQQTNESEIISLMVGRQIQDLFPRPKTTAVSQDVAFSVSNLCAPHPTIPRRLRLDNISFEVKAGEIVGIAGLMGAGRSESVMGIFGALKGTTYDQMTVRGKPVRLHTPHDAITHGLALATEDRKRYGLVLESPVRVNMSLANLAGFSRLGFVDQASEKRACKAESQKLRVKTSSLETPVRNLSGGNQQKVVLGKCLLSNPKVLFLDEPTRGIDIGAKQEIYRLIFDLASQGMAIVLVSSELPEILGLSDRILVMCEGRITGQFNRADADQEKIMTLATSFRKKERENVH